MKTRHARLIRKGILAARDPELRQYVHLGSRLFREAARREAVRIEWRQELADAHARRSRTPTQPTPGSFDGFIYVETGDAVLDAANRLTIFGATGTIPQRVAVGIDPATIKAEQAEHLRRFYA